MAVSVSTKVRDMVYIALCAVLIAVCSWISIPTTVPFTMQTFGVFLTVGLLGGKRGTLAVIVYLLLGAIGVPVYAGFTSGLGVLLGSTGGYFAGFLLTALIMWAMEGLKKPWALVLSMVLGLIVCYAFGTAWFVLVYTRTTGAVGVWTALMWCVIPYILPDCLKIVLALLVRDRVVKALGGKL